MGYYNISAIIPTDQSTSLALEGAFLILNSSISALEAIFGPFLDHMNNSYPVEVAHSAQYAPNSQGWWGLSYSAGTVVTVNPQLLIAAARREGACYAPAGACINFADCVSKISVTSKSGARSRGVEREATWWAGFYDTCMAKSSCTLEYNESRIRVR